MVNYLKAYLFIALAVGGIGFLDSSLNSLTVCPCSYQVIVDLIAFLFFIINIIALGLFWHQRNPSLTLILPIYHLLFFIILNLSASFFALNDSFSLTTLKMYNLISILGSLFEIAFSIYLLTKFKMIQFPSKSKSHIHH